MKVQKKLSALRNADAETAKKIASQYPPDWDMDAVFRKSYEKYQNLLGEDVPEEPVSKPVIRMHTNRLVTAACLLLTVGIAGVFGYIHYSMREPDVKPEPTVTATVPIEELRPDRTDSTAAAIVTTITATDAAPQTSVTALTQTAESLPAYTVTAVTGSSPSDSETQPTAVLSEQQTEPPVQTAAPASATASEITTETVSGATFNTVSETASAAASEQTSPHTENTASAPADEPATDNTDERQGIDAPHKSGQAERLEAYEENGNIIVKYTFEDQTHYAHPALTVTDDSYRVLENDEPDTMPDVIEHIPDGIRYYLTTESGREYATMQFEKTKYTYKLTDINGMPGCFVNGDRITYLIWFDGRYLCVLNTEPAHESNLLALAASVSTH